MTTLIYFRGLAREYDRVWLCNSLCLNHRSSQTIYRHISLSSWHDIKASHGIGIRRKWGNVHLICFIAEQKRWLVFKNAKTIKGLILTFNINWVEQYRRTGISCSTGMAKSRRPFCIFLCGSSENSGWLDYNSVTCNAVWLVQLNRLTMPWQNGKLLIFSQIYMIHLWVSS